MIIKQAFPDGLPLFFSVFNQDDGFFNSEYPQLLEKLLQKKTFERGGDFDIKVGDLGLVFLYDDFRDTYKNSNSLLELKKAFVIEVVSKNSDSFYKNNYQFKPQKEKSPSNLKLIPNRLDDNNFEYFSMDNKKLI